MLVFAFFSAVFTSVCWTIYALMFIHNKLAGELLSAQDLSTMLMFLTVVFLPVLVIWMIFGYVNQFLINRAMNKKQNELLTQLQKNQDYTDLIVRVMLDAEHEIKDGFVLNKFDMFIADMNEALSEIIQRCNIASSAQLEQLWQKVRRGERGALGKAILDVGKNQSTFNAWVQEKVGRDSVFRGSLLEFCSRYQNLLQLLEKHDRDRVFVRTIESGVFGKVYSIMAPMTKGIGNFGKNEEPHSAKINAAAQKTNEYTSALKLATMEEPKAEESIINVDKDDETTTNRGDYAKDSHKSFFSRFNLFAKREEPVFESDEEDPFFQALHNSFHGKDENAYPVFDNADDNKEPSLSARDKDEPQISSTSSFGQLRETLDNLRLNNTVSDIRAARDEQSFPNTAHNHAESAQTVQNTTEIFANKDEQTNENPSDIEENDEDLVYPFGGWTDESNYGK